MKKDKEIATGLLRKAGVNINGSNSWDIQVHSEDFYSRAIKQQYLGIGESYMEGLWDCPNLDQLVFKFLRANLRGDLINWRLVLHFLKAAIFNYQTKSGGLRAKEHYNIGNDLYKAMLGSSMAYTCGYWKQAKNLDEAQYAKLDLVCKKLGLVPGMKVLDIGCGWGSFMKFAAENYKVSVVGVTISEEQIKLGRQLCSNLPVEFRLQDYREIKGSYDRIVSLGMFEHVGHKNYRIFMKVVKECLKDDGLFLLHTIGSNKSVTSAEPWINKYIFPGGMLPSLQQISRATEKLFIVEDLHNFGANYDKTLMAWFENFDKNWDSLKVNYDQRFYRMWKYYLLACAGMFRARGAQLWQIVLSQNGVLGGYNSIR